MAQNKLPFEINWGPNGENSQVIIFNSHTEDNLSVYCQQIAKQLRLGFPELSEIIPARESITLVSEITEELRAPIEQTIQSMSGLGDTASSTSHLIPVCYDARVAPDLLELSERLSMTPEELSQMHHSATYQVDMLGFIPGFLYLSGLPEQLRQARKETPALSVPPGSIAIGGKQTGIYSLESPGGWWVIGRTPATLIEVDQNPPMVIEPLDTIRFQSINYDQWLELHD